MTPLPLILPILARLTLMLGPLASMLGPLATPRTAVAAFSPADEPSLYTWLEARFIAGKVNGDPVGVWEDQHTTNRDGTAGGSPNPIYLTNQVNGRPAIRSESGVAFHMNVPFPGTPCTLFTVVYHPAGVNRSVIETPYVYSDGTSGDPLNLFASANATSAADPARGQWNVIGAVFNGAASGVIVNGTLHAATGNPGTLAAGTATMGTLSRSCPYYAAYLACSGVLSNARITDFCNYLKGIYATP